MRPIQMVDTKTQYQKIKNQVDQAVLAVMESSAFINGKPVQDFTANLSAYLGVKHTIPCANGTDALQIAMMALDLQPGDEVITPPITFIATQATAAMFGAKIVFVDVQADTGNIDPELVEAAITSRTRALVAVDYAGHPADLDELRLIADKYGLYLIEDAAHSLGSTYNGKPVGSIADLTTFSFFPTKNITSAEGGAVSSNNRELLQKVRRFSRQGLVRNESEFIIQTEGAWHQEVHEFGLNYRLPDVLGALGLSQIKRIEVLKEKRKNLFLHYQKIFSPKDDLRTPICKPFVDPFWHLYSIHVPREKRKEWFDELRELGIGVQVNYMPAHWHPAFNNVNAKNFLPISKFFYETQISLPFHTSLSAQEIDYISEKVLNLK